MRRRSLDLSQIKGLILDEADEMLRMGFIDDVETILAQTPPECQRALFSATMPNQMAKVFAHDKRLAVKKPPFMIIPIELKIAWSPLLQHDPGHQWLRRLIVDLGKEIIAQQ